MNAAPLPWNTSKNLGYCLFQAKVRIGDNQLDAPKASIYQRLDKSCPERAVLGGPNVEAEYFAIPVTVYGNGDNESHGLHLPALSNLGKSCVQIQIGILLELENSAAELLYGFADALA